MAFADDLGGADKLSTSQSATIRQLAANLVESEKIQAAIVKGEKVDHEQFVRLSNLQARLQRQLGLKAGAAAEEGPTLASLLASREPA
ncbi:MULTISPECIES: hypothetical protein [unclassified Aureimonas]|uniref:hypothetical protein n=1 Tax=unclassified Aureimonas TaxID=2615206 RepID=UPI001FCD0632|nr:MULTISPECIES: hypothetical protein [unclassified Aureimonas]